MKYVLIEKPIDNGCDGCCFNEEGKPCLFPNGKAGCYNGGIYVQISESEQK